MTKRRERLVGNRVLVGRDIHLVQPVLEFLAGDAGLPQIHEHQVIVGAARDQLHPAGKQAGGQGFRVFDDLV